MSEIFTVNVRLYDSTIGRLYNMSGLSGSLADRVIQIFREGLAMREDPLRQVVESSLRLMRKDTLINHLLRCHDEGKVSLCTLQMPEPQSVTPDESVRRLSDLLKDYADENTRLKARIEELEAQAASFESKNASGRKKKTKEVCCGSSL